MEIKKRQTDAGNRNRVRRLIVTEGKGIRQTFALYRESIALTDKAGLLAYSSGYRPSHSAGAEQWTFGGNSHYRCLQLRDSS